jgi:hypothetical protein
MLGCGHPMGPLALADLIGLDTIRAIGISMYEEFEEPLYSPPPLLDRMVDAFPSLRWRCVVVCSGAVLRHGGQARIGLSVIPSPRLVRHGVVRQGLIWLGGINQADHHAVKGSDTGRGGDRAPVRSLSGQLLRRRAR